MLSACLSSVAQSAARVTVMKVLPCLLGIPGMEGDNGSMSPGSDLQDGDSHLDALMSEDDDMQVGWRRLPASKIDSM